MSDALRQRASELAIETFYWDDEGNRHDANPEALQRVVDAVEADYARSSGRRTNPIVLGDPERVYAPGCQQAQLKLADGTTLDVPVWDDHVVIDEHLPVGSHHLAMQGPGFEESSTIVVAPSRMSRSAALDHRAAVFAPAYALWEQSSPLPSFGNVASLCQTLPVHNIDALITLPLYAAFLDDPYDASPYAPVSRLHWNEVYLDDAGLPAAPVPSIGDVIDWRTLAQRRRRQLLEAASQLGDNPALAARVARWSAANPDVAAYAQFRSTVRPDPTDAGFPAATIEASHQLAQLLAHDQLSAIESGGSAAFALDLPIGAHPDGYESWAFPDLWAPAMSVGAPPDALFRDGQNWGFPPQLPGEAERTGFALWRHLVAQCGRYASLLRIDHILGLHRLWWVPDGMSPTDGVYVRYPRHSLMSVIAAEAARWNTTVVGEDLGTVPDELRELLAQWDLLGLYAEELAISGDLRDIPHRRVAGMRTHDMPAFATMFSAGGEQLNPDGGSEGLEIYRQKLSDRLGFSVPDTLEGVLDASLTRLAKSDAYLVFADLDDLLGETRPHNVPGMILPGTWSRRFDQPTSATLAQPRVERGLSLLSDRSATP